MKKQFLPILILILFSVNISAQLGPAIKWQKCLGGTKDDRANDVILTPDGGMLVAGYSNSNDGDVTGHHGGIDTADAWLAKLDASGNLQWQKSIGGTGSDYFNAIIATNDNNYLCIGKTSSNNGDVSGNHGSYDIWAVKITPAGSILWSRCYGGTKTENASDGIITSDGGFAIIGNTGSNNGDVSGLNTTLSAGADIWIIKISSAGSLIWQKCYGDVDGAGDTIGGDIIEDADQQLVAVVHVSGSTSDFAGAYTGEYHIKVNKNNGAYIYKKGPGDRFSSNGSLVKTSNGGILESYNAVFYYPSCGSANGVTSMLGSDGSFSRSFKTPGSCVGGGSTADFPYSSWYAGAHGIAALGDSSFIGIGGLFDDGTGPVGSSSSGHANVGIGNFVNHKYFYKKYGGSGQDFFNSVKVLPSGNDYIVVGYTSSNNFDVSGNHGGYDCWVVRLVGVNNISGNVFVDFNGNGVKDAGDTYFDKVIVKSEKPGLAQSGLPYHGFFQNSVDTGNYNTTVVLSRPYYTITPASKTSAFTSYKNTDTVNFALKPIAGMRDYAIAVSAPGTARPGFPFGYNLTYSNNGTDTMLNKKIVFIKDRHAHFTQAGLTPSAVSGDTITWIIPSLLPAGNAVIGVSLKLDSIPVLSINDTLLARFYIDSTLDVLPADNQVLLRTSVRGSYDPNDKQENNGGFTNLRDIASSKKFNYTIRFQNTGNDTAFNIVVRDTLDTKLDWNSIEMVESSHPYQLNIKDGRYCTWQFNDIKLADSVHNEPLSHGYFTYSIRPVSTLGLGDSVRNTASIYFDFNPGVRTNTQVTIVKQPALPPAPQATGIRSNYCSNLGIQKIKIINLPTGGSGITAIAKLDGTNLSIAADSTVSFNTSSVAAGTHQLLIIYSNDGAADSLKASFNVVAPVTPDVNLAANIITVTNLTDPVIITASNASGGGTTPIYTFAKDKSFANILQAEGKANTLTIQPNTLTVGANWIYVRMKTSDTCYTTQTNTDSIEVERSTITGITDVDFPGQIINIYPNPFTSTIVVNGLNTGKIYTISITNAAGQKIYSRQLGNSRSATINQPGLQGGRYWLSIYDDKKHRLIGTSAIIKQ